MEADSCYDDRDDEYDGKYEYDDDPDSWPPLAGE